MLNKRFDLIEKTDIDELISNEEPESRNLDYKQELPGGKDEDKKEFLADVSSFANAAGGHILYGISEKRDEGKPTGIPEIADGLSINADTEIKRLESLIRDGIDPRLTGCHIREITGFPKGPVILVHIPKSWMPPHMVTIKGSSRFFSRTSKGKYPLDIMEIRSAVMLSESLADKVRQFRDSRLAKIIAEETPVQLFPYGKIIMHVFPISALDLTMQIDVKSIDIGQLQPLGEGGWNNRFNFDGLLTYRCNRDSSDCDAYLQLFRNGAIETVDSHMLGDVEKWGKTIPTTFEKRLISSLKNYLKFEQRLGFEPPIFVMISFTGVKDYAFHGGHTKIDRDSLILPDILVEDYNLEPSLLLRPAFDTVWQSTGRDGSPNYEGGNWKES
jgi:hypothetical protein